MKLQPGDIFTTQNTRIFGKLINFFQILNAEDGESEYTHAGIITSAKGDSFESLWHIRRSNINAYKGVKILIGRHDSMTPEVFERGWNAVKEYEGMLYPFWELPLHLIPWTAKIGDWPVCSELTFKFLDGCGITDYWKGTCPDDVADMIHRWRGWSIVYEGVYQGAEMDDLDPCKGAGMGGGDTL